MPYERVHVLGVPVDPVVPADVLSLARDRVQHGPPARICTVNVEYVICARQDRAFADILESADLATPDGSGILWALRRRGIHRRERVGGSDLIWSLSEQAATFGHSVFLLGGSDGVAGQAARKLQASYPRLAVAGTYAGTPSVQDEFAIVDLIRRSGADILFVAFGAPQQDMWIARNLIGTGVAFAMGVGGSFDYLAGTARRAPMWMREHGTEWLWRLIRQPWRWKRMLAIPWFVWLILTHDRGPLTERKEE